ncbi:MAG TPA: hypothetical protein VHG93_20695 [Longimicrobium sp.]|nr:hypothetical protein [Longimicrobium sp.]
MRRLIRPLLFCSVAIALAAQAAIAQAPASSAAAAVQPSAPPGLCATAPLPRTLVPPAALRAVWNAGTEVEAMDTTFIPRRSGWKYPLIGLGVGALVGAAYGTWVMAHSEEWIAPPAHVVTVPAGALLGLAIGGAANLLHPR